MGLCAGQVEERKDKDPGNQPVHSRLGSALRACVGARLWKTAWITIHGPGESRDSKRTNTTSVISALKRAGAGASG